MCVLVSLGTTSQPNDQQAGWKGGTVSVALDSVVGQLVSLSIHVHLDLGKWPFLEIWSLRMSLVKVRSHWIKVGHKSSYWYLYKKRRGHIEMQGRRPGRGRGSPKPRHARSPQK